MDSSSQDLERTVRRTRTKDRKGQENESNSVVSRETRALQRWLTTIGASSAKPVTIKIKALRQIKFKEKTHQCLGNKTIIGKKEKRQSFRGFREPDTERVKCICIHTPSRRGRERPLSVVRSRLPLRARRGECDSPLSWVSSTHSSNLRLRLRPMSGRIKHKSGRAFLEKEMS